MLVLVLALLAGKAVTFTDPLTREKISAAELRARALEDLQAGHNAAAAGRYTLLCEGIAGKPVDKACAVGDVEAWAAALLLTRLFSKAETALLRAVSMPGHEAQDWKSLASLYSAEGRDTEATAAERVYAKESKDAG